MKKLLVGALMTAAVTFGGSAAQAADLPVKAYKAPPAPMSLWEVEVGIRYWYNSGRMRYTLGDPFTAGQINSQLTERGISGHAGEAFFRVEHVSGIFLKGFLGGGSIGKGTLQDEDFPPALVPYSSTDSSITSGNTFYGTIDFGYDFWKTQTWRLGAFAGYNHFREHMDAYGCNQTAGNFAICGVPIPANIKVLSQTADWDSVRIGLNGTVNFTPQLHLNIDAAYLPYVSLGGHDNHWLRPDINPLPEQGHGWGYQLEALLAYDVTQNFSLGVGGRYWYAKTTSGTIQFPLVPSSPTTFSTDRYGVFVQGSYKFNSY